MMENVPFYQTPLGVHALMALALIWPMMRLCRRAGLSPLWAFSVIIPIFGPACIATILALRTWPTLPPLPAAPPPRKRA